MNKLYEIKKNHPIKHFIRQEILKNGYDKYGNIGVCALTIDSESLVEKDLYGLIFNINNFCVPCINARVFINPISNDAPFIIEKHTHVSRFYKRYFNCTIKLKTFLEKNPQWSKIEEWATLIKEPKIKCEYCFSSPNQFYFKRPDRKLYVIKTKEPQNNKLFNYMSDVDCIPSTEKNLTNLYYTEKDYDKKNNVKRDLFVVLKNIIFNYDYRDGIVEIHNIKMFEGNHSELKLSKDVDEKHSIYKKLIKNSKTINDCISDETKRKIKKEIESRDLKVKDIILIKHKHKTNEIKVRLFESKILLTEKLIC